MNEQIEYQAANMKNLVNATTINSPFSFSLSPFPFTFSQAVNGDLMETSFQEDLFQDHVSAIWKSSLTFLKNCVKGQFDEQKGFNDRKVFDVSFSLKSDSAQELDIMSAITSNSYLTRQQKNIISLVLRKQKNLKSLLERLFQKFALEIIQQIILIFYEVLEKYLKFKQTKKCKSELAQYIFPAFQSISSQKIQNFKPFDFYEHTQEGQIIAKADQIGSQIAANLFISTNLRYLNLNDTILIKSNSNFVRSQFEHFIKNISQAIFLCLQGFFNHPNGQTESFLTQPSFKQCSSFSQKICGSKEEQAKGYSGRKRINDQ